LQSDPDDPLAVRLLYAPHTPHPPQHAFYLLDELGVLEAFYGGAGGGGKSDALLTAALRYADVPGYNALLLRRSFADLNLPGAIMARAREWLAGTDAQWNDRDSRFTFPSTATLSFGYLQTKSDKFRYASAEFQFVGFDELTGFLEADYTFLFTRLRKPNPPGWSEDNPTGQAPELDTPQEAAIRALAGVPLRMRSAGNPGGRGHLWVRRRLVERRPAERRDDEPPDPTDTPERAAARRFIPAKLEDNPSVDADAYRESLAAVDEHTRRQIELGDWYARQPGDWVYDQDGLQAAYVLGDELDEELARGTIAPPAGDLLAIGLDWGEHSHGLILWPLEGGGIYVAAEAVGVGLEPEQFAGKVYGRRRAELEDDELEVAGALDVIYTLASRPRPGGLPPAMPPDREPLELVSDHRYDAAGIQSMRTYMARARKHRHRRARSTSIPFGAPAPQSGRNASPRSFKAETIGHLRGLVNRARDGRRTRVLAVSARCPVLRGQLRELEWADQEAGIVKKGNDHGPDALIAGAAPDAVKARSGP
jgi:hypothetical protein